MWTQNEHRAMLFARAVKRHIEYAKWAADGQGVDRHLFGLRKVLREGEEMPAMFTDAAFARTSHWELSTSQLSSPFIDGWGYGEGELGKVAVWIMCSCTGALSAEAIGGA